MQYPKLLVSLFLWACIADKYHAQQDFAGPFRLVLHQIGLCDEMGTRQMYVSSTRINKVSRTKYLYSTNVTTEVVVSDEMTAVMDIASFGNGGWKPNFMQVEFPQACTSMKNMMPMFYEAVKNAACVDCPAPPGTYQIGNLDLENIQVGNTVPSFPYGKYRSDFSGWINGTLVGCVRCFFDAVPAKRSRPKKKPKHAS